MLYQNRRQSRSGGVPDEVANAEQAGRARIVNLLRNRHSRRHRPSAGERMVVADLRRLKRAIRHGLREGRDEEVLELVGAEPGVPRRCELRSQGKADDHATRARSLSRTS